MRAAPAPRVCGIVLAGGAGTRFGGPKALARTEEDEPWLRIVAATLTAAGCDPVIVALGARTEEATMLAPEAVRIVVAEEWERWLSATLRSALAEALCTDADAALIVPVDIPDLPAAVVARILAMAGRDVLVRAVYGGRPGHPALVGREHWERVVETAAGDRGAGPYLRSHGARDIECRDLWDGEDIDVRPV